MKVPYTSRLAWLLKDRTRLMYFVHVPKCGGKFVESAFKPFISDCPLLTEAWTAGHQTYAEYKEAFGARGLNFDKGYKFAVVRNPWDWHVSWFHYLKGDPTGADSGHVIEGRLFQTMSLEDYVDWLSDDSAPRSPQGYLQRQMCDWLVDGSNRIAIDRVLRQERLANDLRAMAADLRLEITVRDAKINASQREDYRRYYNDRTAEAIASRHTLDIALFGYTF